MVQITIASKTRDASEKPASIRARKAIPAVVYGHGIESRSVAVEYSEFVRAYRQAGGSTVVNLTIDEKPESVLVHEVSFHPVRDTVEHIDFKIVKMDEEITATVPVKILGISPAVKDFGGILITQKNELEVRCLPGDLPHEIEIDISVLEKFGDAVHVGDLKISDKVKFDAEADETIVSVTEPRVEEEVVASEAATDVADGEKPTESADGAEKKDDKTDDKKDAK